CERSSSLNYLLPRACILRCSSLIPQSPEHALSEPSSGPIGDRSFRWKVVASWWRKPGKLSFERIHLGSQDRRDDCVDCKITTRTCLAHSDRSAEWNRVHFRRHRFEKSNHSKGRAI